MKKIIAISVLLATVFTLASCGYRPVESTAEEKETVITMRLENESYEVPYELYRAFFLNYKSVVDCGNDSVWSSDDKDRYIEEIDDIILPMIAEIYAVFHLSLKRGIDPFSKTVEQSIKEYVIVGVEGGSVDGMRVEGFGGDYDAYLADLKENNINYSVQAIFFRYAICVELLTNHYLDKTSQDTITFTKEDVLDFYYSDDCARVMRVFFDTSTKIDQSINTADKISYVQQGMIDRAGNESAVADFVLGNTFEGESIRNGEIISEYSLDGAFYSEITDAALSLDMHEVSEPIYVVTGTSNGYHILYRMEKSDSHFNTYYEDIELFFIQDMMGEDIDDTKDALKDSMEKLSSLTERDYSKISMN